MRLPVGGAGWCTLATGLVALGCTLLPWLSGTSGGYTIRLSSWELWVIGPIAAVLAVALSGCAAVGAWRASPWWWLGASFIAGLTAALAATGIVAAGAVSGPLGWIPDSWATWLPDRSDEWVPTWLVGQVPEDPTEWIPQLGPGVGLWVSYLAALVGACSAGVAAVRAAHPKAHGAPYPAGGTIGPAPVGPAPPVSPLPRGSR